VAAGHAAIAVADTLRNSWWQALLAAGAEVTVMNRGVSTPATDFGDRVTTVKCDRKSDEFPAFLRASGSWDAIVDYIAYTVEDVEPLIAELGAEMIGHYVYISSDSTYMGSDPAKFVREDGRLLEQSTVRPADEAFAKLRHDSDNYGSNKLYIEEYLAEQPGLLWTGLRLPDVLGIRKSRLLRDFYTKNAIILPRQARDTHRESTPKTTRFCRAVRPQRPPEVRVLRNTSL
jgi:nucleoside-diphosphate-sugar epimerase